MSNKNKKEESCANCKYYQAQGEKCKRYPPNPSYPDTGPRDWCGEYKPKEK